MKNPVRFAPALALAFAFALAGVILVRLGMIPNPTDGRKVRPAAAGGFGLSEAKFPDRPEEKFNQAAFLLNPNRFPWFGTFVNGDGFTGRATSTLFTLDDDVLEIPILGYPCGPGNSLEFEVFDRKGKVIFARLYAGPNPRETPGIWRVAAPGLRGHSARLVLTDGETGLGGWLAVSRPLDGHRSGVLWLSGVRRDYIWYAVSALALTGLLFIPGLACRAWRPSAPGGAPAVVLPGLLILAAFGGGIWLWGPAALRWPALAWLGLNAAGAVGLAGKWWRVGGAGLPGEVVVWRIYGCGVIAALAFAVLPLAVAQEYDSHTTAQARMVASPPDHGIPYRTAVYFLRQKNGRQDSDAYFGSDWSVASRGPLPALAIAGGFASLGGPRADPPDLSLEAWPASADGFYIARILGILTNALVILGAAALAGRMAPGAAGLAACWLGVAPAIAIDTDFLWPKLLATFFVVIAIRLVLERRPGRTLGCTLALAYLSHPVGGLLAAPVLLFLLQRVWADQPGTAGERLRAALGVGGAAVLWLLLCLAPWLAYKRWLGQADVFYRYPWGDGRGFLAAAGWKSWWQCRWDNLWLTLTPGGFYGSGRMQSWLEGAISPPLRWVIGYAKTLPGGLGLGSFLVAVASLVRPAPAWRGFRLSLLYGTFALMLFFWGFSSDGLGRNCLVPLAVILIVQTTAVFPTWAAWRWLLLLTALETLFVRFGGIFFAPEFSSGLMNFEALALSGLVAAATLAPLVLTFARPPGRAR